MPINMVSMSEESCQWWTSISGGRCSVYAIADSLKELVAILEMRHMLPKITYIAQKKDAQKKGGMCGAAALAMIYSAFGIHDLRMKYGE